MAVTGARNQPTVDRTYCAEDRIAARANKRDTQIKEAEAKLAELQKKAKDATTQSENWAERLNRLVNKSDTLKSAPYRPKNQTKDCTSGSSHGSQPLDLGFTLGSLNPNLRITDAIERDFTKVECPKNDADCEQEKVNAIELQKIATKYRDQELKTGGAVLGQDMLIMHLKAEADSDCAGERPALIIHSSIRGAASNGVYVAEPKE